MCADFHQIVQKSLEYYYLKVQLETEKQCEPLDAILFKQLILESIKSMFGEVGAGIDVDILKYTCSSQEAILRVHSSFYVKVWGALTLCGTSQGWPCAFRVLQASPHLMCLAVNSREFNA